VLAVSVTSPFTVPALTMPATMLPPPVAVSTMSLVSTSASDCTSVAGDRSAGCHGNRAVCRVDIGQYNRVKFRHDNAPAPVTLISALLAVVLNVMPAAAVAVTTSAVTRPVGLVVEIVPLPVLAVSVTSPFNVPALTVVMTMLPPPVAVSAISLASASVSD